MLILKNFVNKMTLNVYSDTTTCLLFYYLVLVSASNGHHQASIYKNLKMLVHIQCFPLVTEPDISLIILLLMRIWLADRCSVSQQLGALQTHSSSFLTQRTYCCSNFVAISSLPGSVASGTPCIYIIYIYNVAFIQYKNMTLKQMK